MVEKSNTKRGGRSPAGGEDAGDDGIERQLSLVEEEMEDSLSVQNEKPPASGR